MYRWRKESHTVIEYGPSSAAIAKLKSRLPFTPAIPPLGIHLAVLAQIFIAAVVIILNNWKHPKCVRVGEWIVCIVLY